MKYDYSASCSCGKEFYSDTIQGMKGDAKQHMLNHLLANKRVHAVYINRHFKGSDIDDSFDSIKIEPGKGFQVKFTK